VSPPSARPRRLRHSSGTSRCGSGHRGRADSCLPGSRAAYHAGGEASVAEPFVLPSGVSVPAPSPRSARARSPISGELLSARAVAGPGSAWHRAAPPLSCRARNTLGEISGFCQDFRGGLGHDGRDTRLSRRIAGRCRLGPGPAGRGRSCARADARLGPSPRYEDTPSAVRYERGPRDEDRGVGVNAGGCLTREGDE